MLANSKKKDSMTNVSPKDKEEEISDLLSQINYLTKAIEEAKISDDNNEKKILSLNEENERLIEKNKSLNERIEEFNNKLKGREKEISDLLSQINYLTKAIEEAKINGSISKKVNNRIKVIKNSFVGIIDWLKTPFYGENDDSENK